MSKNSVIIDFETIGNGQTNPNCAVLSFAAIVFDPSEVLSFDELVNNAIRLKFDLNEQLNIFGRTTDQDVIDFWKKDENKEAFEFVCVQKPDDISISRLGVLLDNYLSKMGFDPSENGKIYCRGNAFDFPIFSNIYKYFGWEEPWAWWNIRDVRTEVDSVYSHVDPHHEGFGYIKNFPYPDNFVKHKEEHDCARDILMMQYAHSALIDKVGEQHG